MNTPATPHPWENVRGWLEPCEGQALAALAAGARVLELGSFAGRSTVCMAAVATHVTAVDWHRGDDGTGPADTAGEFLRNLDTFGVRDRVRPIFGRIEDVGPTLEAGSYDLAFIDSAHDYDSALRDARIALRCVRPGGTIAWHDSQMDTVNRAMRDAGLTPTGRAWTLAWCVLPPPSDPASEDEP